MRIGDAEVIQGDSLSILRTLPAESVNCCVTSPPYWGLRDYGVDGQLGLEPTPELYVEHIVAIFEEVRRVLRKDGTCWVNLGDSYANDGKLGGETGGKQAYLDDKSRRRVGREKRITGLKPKDLVGIPWRVAFALQASGWWLRSDIIWAKPNPMPESVTDRPTRAHEYIFLLTKSARYYYNAEAIKEPAIYFDTERSQKPQDRRPIYKDARSYDGKHTDKQRGHGRRHAGFNDWWDAMSKQKQCRAMRNKRSVWEIATQPFTEAHFATFPEKLVEPCIIAGCPEDGTVLDPFHGSGTTGVVALNHCRKYIGIELNQKYIDISIPRITEAWKHQPRLFKDLEKNSLYTKAEK